MGDTERELETDDPSETTDSSDKPSKPVPRPQPNDPLHGITLKMMLTELVDEIGWDDIAAETGIRNFTDRPTLPSGLKFLRKTPWAKKKLEDVYLEYLLWKRDNT